MSENTPQEVAPQANAENDTEKLLAEIERLQSTNDRLLMESKQNKTKRTELDELRGQLEAYQKKEMEQKGNYQEMLNLEIEKRQKLESELRERDGKLLKSNIFNAVANYAKDAHDVNDLLAQKDYASMIEINEDSLEPVSESIYKFVDSLKENKAYLFKGKTPKPMGHEKAGSGISKPAEKSLANMSKEERNQKMRELIAKAL